MLGVVNLPGRKAVLRPLWDLHSKAYRINPVSIDENRNNAAAFCLINVEPIDII